MKAEKKEEKNKDVKAEEEVKELVKVKAKEGLEKKQEVVIEKEKMGLIRRTREIETWEKQGNRKAFWPCQTCDQRKGMVDDGRHRP